MLGVEGIDEYILEEILAKAGMETDAADFTPVTKADFYTAGLSGKPDSSARRTKLAKKLGLPPRLSANGLLELINQTGGKELFDKFTSD